MPYVGRADARRHPDWLIPGWNPPGVGALMTTRKGGFSAAPFDSLNLRPGLGDDATAVARNQQLLAYADVCHQQSDGLFDITSGILRRVWNFKAERPPSRESIALLLPLIGWQHVVRGAGTVYLSKVGMEIDFGGFGKEYAADRAAAVLLSFGLRHAFVNLGGDVVVTGPLGNGEPWHLGVRHPRNDDEVLAVLPITSGAVATSGDYERFLEFEGQRYSHILDPRTGESVQGFQSVTAFAPTCLVAGSITTIAMLKGPPTGKDWLHASGSQFLAVDSAAELFSNWSFK